ncbi:MAG: acetate kinase [Firmicutes bacterium]|nr:acetate kinase [Bacillota bacterium]
MKILVINAGSSSLKYQLIDINREEVMAKGLCERIGINGSRLKHKPNHSEGVTIEKSMQDHAEAIRMVIDALRDERHGVIKDMSEISAVGHRVVHGGEYFSESVLIDHRVKEAIDACSSLAPLHNPPNLTGIKACEEAMPGVPMVAVFDTAFHQTMPPQAYLYALPYEMYEKHRVRKYGFHGTSHKYVTQRAAVLMNKPIEELKIITCHLGNGSSVAAVKSGISIDTSMGFTPLAGVVMGTRTGLIDPAIVTYLMETENMSIKEINNLLNKKSGVLGISGISSDFRDIDDAADEGNERAQLALDIFAYSIRQYIGKYMTTMGGIDAVVFTAGIGENNSRMRAHIVKGLEFLGIKIDAEKNAVRGQELDISTPDATVSTLVIPTNEEFMIALDTKRIVNK